jgi:hypothetical protein
MGIDESRPELLQECRQETAQGKSRSCERNLLRRRKRWQWIWTN